MHEALVLIPTRIWDFTDFFWDISLDNETTTVSSAQMEGVYGDSYVH